MSQDVSIVISAFIIYLFMLSTIAFTVYIILKKLIAFYFQKKEEYSSKFPYK